MKLKIIKIKIYVIIYVIYNKIMFSKFLGPICNNKKLLNND
jgi:hypothetical protein